MTREVQAGPRGPVAKKREPSKIPAVLVLCGGILLIFWGVVGGELIPAKGIALTLAGLGYLLIRKRIPAKLKMAIPSSLQRKPSISLILNIVFLIAFSYTLITVATYDVYSIPVGYFVSTVVMCIVIALDVFLMPREKTAYTYIILVKIIVLSLLLIWIPHNQFPNIGTDPWYHMSFVEAILRGSHIPSIGYDYYRDFTAMHFLVAAIKEMTGLGIMNSMMLVGSIVVACLSVLFCLGKVLFSERVGLLGALLLGVTSTFVFWGYYIIPMTLGIGLAVVLTYLMIRRTTASRRPAFTALFLLATFVIVYTHTIVGIICLVVAMSMYLGEKLLSVRSRGKLSAYVSFVTPLLFGVVMISYWAYVSGYFFSEAVHGLAHVFSFPTSEYVWTKIPNDITPAILKSIGFMCLIGLGAVAILYSWDHRKDYRTSLMLIAAGLGVVIVLYAGYLSGLAEILVSDRWDVFMFMLFSILAGLGVFLVYCSFRGKLLKLFSISLIVLVFSFTMISTSLLGHSNPLVDKDASQRGFFFDSEIVAADTISSLYDGKIISDYFHDNYFELVLGRETGDIYYSFIVPEEAKVKDVIVIRRYILNYIFASTRPVEEIKVYANVGVLLNETQKDKVRSLNEDPIYSKIYCNSEVVAYMPQPMEEGE